ncbi:MAG: hypothetical protein H8F28_07875 [Fibrella sp.]|nr:hypothetical protein [Armatimonadota bacterium]
MGKSGRRAGSVGINVRGVYPRRGNRRAVLQKYGASDEKRETLVADLGDSAQWLLRSATESGVTTLANMRIPDFSQLGERMITMRDKRIADRRERLVAEINGAKNESD